jgi:tetratricopeptide (TPR) repeat protein
VQRPAAAAKAEALIGLGRLQEARALLERRPATDDDGTWVAEYWRQVRFQLAVAEGDLAMANSLADRAAALWLGPAAQDMSGTAPSTMPPALVRMGRSEEALQILEKALQSVASAEGYLWVLRHPGLRSLHGDPRFARLVEKGRSNVAITVRVLERAKANGELPAYLEPFLVEMRDLLESPGPRG